MVEHNLDFDTIIERKHTDSLKYDFAVQRGKPEDVLPLWVADMDFCVPSGVQEALAARVAHGIFGYSEAGEAYFRAVSGWMNAHYGWEVQREWLVKTPGVVFAIAQAVKAFTNEGDGVLIQQPVYYPFAEAIRDNGRVVADNTLTQDEQGRYQIDFADFEGKIVEYNVKLFLLCNPHNPVGRVWSAQELRHMGDICVKYGVIVVSDEIHADFVWKGRHRVFADLKEEYRDITVTATAPSKTFNLAGLQVSNIFVPNPVLRQKLEREIAASGYSQVNALGLVACEAAYRDGEAWHQSVCGYIRKNIAYAASCVRRDMPGVKMTEPEGTYLIWLDLRGLGLSEEQQENLLVNKARLWLDDGALFGEGGKGFVRINAACPRKILAEALERLAGVLNHADTVPGHGKVPAVKIERQI